MAKKLYESEKIKAIAEKIREKTGNTTKYKTETMPDGIEEVYKAGMDSVESVKLPELTNQGTSEDLVLGKQLIDGDGNVVDGGLKPVLVAMGLQGDPYLQVASESQPSILLRTTYDGERVYLYKGVSVGVYAPVSDFGNATPDMVVSPYTFTSASGLEVEGTLRQVHGSETSVVSPVKGYNIGPCVKMSYTPSEKKVLSPGDSFIDLCSPFSEFGDVPADKVPKGYTFTSSAGLREEGTAEKITEDNITFEINLDDDFVPVTVPTGFVETDFTKNVDITEIADNRYDLGWNDGYVEGYDDGYNVGFDAGSAGGTADPTTVWELPATLNFVTFPESITVSFNSAGIDFIGIKKFVQNIMTYITYIKSDGSETNAYVLGRWTNDAYRTITIYEKIADEAFLDWLTENATLISGSIGGGESGGNNAEIEEMLLDSDANYDDQGFQFYSICKWIDVWNSALSSAPVIITAFNRHETLWMHLYIKVSNWEGYHYFTLTVEPDGGENSIEIDFSIDRYIVEGVRWSKHGV